MKNFKIILIAIVAIFVSSCSKDDNPTSYPIPDTTITGKAVATADLSILVQALQKAGLATTLQGAGPYTVFAPTNAAFTSFLNANGFTSLNDVPVAVLKEILLNHVLTGKKLAVNLSTGYEKTLAKGGASTTNALSMYVNKTDVVKLNGVSMVTTADILASNGVIHIVDKVIGLPTIVTHATANSNFSILVSALTRTDQINFVGILSGTASPSPFTVFAPTNDAFVSFLTETTYPSLAAIPTSVLDKTLKYHVITARHKLN